MLSDPAEPLDCPQPERARPGVVVELPTADRSAAAAGRSIVTEAQVRTDVDRALQAIKNAGSNLGLLSERSRGYEENIRDLKKMIAELRGAQDVAGQKAVKAEARIRQETERAVQAEARVRAFEGQVKQMELREKTIMGNLDRVMRLVDATFGLPERAAEQGLKSA